LFPVPPPPARLPKAEQLAQQLVSDTDGQNDDTEDNPLAALLGYE
jgi:hypothetical protein